MTAEEINAYANRPNFSQEKLVEATTVYYLNRYYNYEEAAGEVAANEKMNRVDAEKLIKVIFSAVEKYDVGFGKSFLSYLGTKIIPGKSEILPYDGYNNPSDGKRDGVDVKRYHEIRKAAGKVGIDINTMTDEQIEKICEDTGMDKEKFEAAMQAGKIINRISTDMAIDDETRLLDLIPNVGDNEFTQFELELWFMDWFGYLAKRAQQKKYPVYKMLNTNFLENADMEVQTFPEYIDSPYYQYIVEYDKDRKDITVAVFISESAQNFGSVYRKPYNKHMDNYIVEGRKN